MVIVSVITPFGTISYGDKASIAAWQSAHLFRHAAYVQAMRKAGKNVQGTTLDGPIDSDWFGRHLLNHAALARSDTGDVSYAVTILEREWKDEAAFYQWHRTHTLMHKKLDRDLGIRG